MNKRKFMLISIILSIILLLYACENGENQIWKNYVMYSGVIEVGGTPVTVTADAEFIYEASDKQPALSENSHENSMIGTVTANFFPADGD